MRTSRISSSASLSLRYRTSGPCLNLLLFHTQPYLSAPGPSSFNLSESFNSYSIFSFILNFGGRCTASSLIQTSGSRDFIIVLSSSVSSSIAFFPPSLVVTSWMNTTSGASSAMVSATNGKRPTSAGVSGAEAWLELFLPPECLPVLMIFQRDAFLFFCVPVSLWRAFRSPSSLGGFIHNFPCTTPVLEKSARFQVITLSPALRSLWMRSSLRAFCAHFIARRLHSGMMSRSLPGPFPGPRTLIARGREEMRAYRGNGRAHAADRPTRPTRRRRTREGYRGRTQPSVSERSDSHLQRRRGHVGYAALL